MDWSAAVIELQLWLMARWPDTLIARKCGWAVAEESADRAAAILNEFEQRGMATAKQIAEFDAWLRADGHRRNPGTTADLIAATLFATFRDTILDPPTRAQIRQMATVPT